MVKVMIDQTKIQILALISSSLALSTELSAADNQTISLSQVTFTLKVSHW